MEMDSKQEFVAYVGIDWADTKHDIAIRDEKSGKIEYLTLAHTPEAIDNWARSLEERFEGKEIAVSLEQSRGPLIFALLKYSFLVLYPINPKTLWSFRKAFTPSGAKNDLRDSILLLEFLEKHRDRIKPWKVTDEKTQTLQYLVEYRRRLVEDRKKLQNRLTALLKGYFPQALELFSNVGTDLVCDFLIKYSSLEKAQKATPAALIKFFESHNSRNKDLNQKRVALIKESIPLTTNKAVISSSILMVTATVREIKQFISDISSFDSEIESLCSTHQDFKLFNSLPGAGPNFASRLIVAFGTDRNRFSSSDEILCLSGIAPIKVQSGNTEITRWRLFCPKFLRQTFHEFAGQSIMHSFWAKAYYQQQRARGKSANAAKRSLAYKWIRIIFRCWKNNTTYSEVKYLESLRSKGSPLLNFAANKTT